MPVLIGEVFVMAGSFAFIFFILICMITVQKEGRERKYCSRRNKLKKEKEKKKTRK